MTASSIALSPIIERVDMIPIISIVGRSDSGKTTLIEKLIKALRKDGYNIATVKHDIHGFEMDVEGKDSWRHKKAGAQMVIVSSPEKIALIKDVKEDSPLGKIRNEFIDDVDLILTEGYKREEFPKIEVFRKEAGEDLITSAEENLVAIVSDTPFQRGVPCFHLDDIAGIAKFIKEKFLDSRKKRDISLRVNGKDVFLKPFIKNMLILSIHGILSSLKECEKMEEVEIKINF